MKIRDVIEELSQFDQDIELVIDVDGEYVTPSMNEIVVHFKHDYSGTSFKDAAVVLAKR